MHRSPAVIVFLGLALALSAGLAVAEDFATLLFGLTTAPNGDLLVADSGAGVALFDGQPRLEIELPGITDISAIGRSSLWATRTGTDPLGDSGQALFRLSQGSRHEIANLFEFEAMYDPDQGPHPVDPFDVQSLGGDAALVADAAGNDLLRVDRWGAIELLAVFPEELVSTDNLKALFGCPGPSPLCSLPPMIPAQPVPTSIAVGADGHCFVGELKGFPAPTGESRVWRISPAASWADCGASPDCQIVFDGGFTSIIDLAFGPDGRLYVVELDEASWLAPELGIVTGGSINACDLSTLSCQEVATGIPLVTAITFGKKEQLWATQNALVPGAATVVAVP